MPLTHIKNTILILILLTSSISWAQDDYDFTDSGSDTGDDFTFDDPVDANDTGGGGTNNNSPGGGGSDLPSFLQNADEGEQAPTVTAEDLALAKEADKKRIWVRQRRPFLKRKRFELRPIFSSNVNDALVTFFTMGGSFIFILMNSLLLV